MDNNFELPIPPIEPQLEEFNLTESELFRYDFYQKDSKRSSEILIGLISLLIPIGISVLFSIKLAIAIFLFVPLSAMIIFFILENSLYKFFLSKNRWPEIDKIEVNYFSYKKALCIYDIKMKEFVVESKRLSKEDFEIVNSVLFYLISKKEKRPLILENWLAKISFEKRDESFVRWTKYLEKVKNR